MSTPAETRSAVAIVRDAFETYVDQGREGILASYDEFFSPEFEFRELGYEDLGRGLVLVNARVHSRGARSGVELDNEAGFVFRVRDDRVLSGHTFFSSGDAREFARRA